MDGEGYPYGVRLADEPLVFRVLPVADAYEALTADRPYRRAMDSEQALTILRSAAGTAYDPHVVEALADVVALRDIDEVG